jgi:hypothetical protein
MWVQCGWETTATNKAFREARRVSEPVSTREPPFDGSAVYYRTADRIKMNDSGDLLAKGGDKGRTVPMNIA